MGRCECEWEGRVCMTRYTSVGAQHRKGGKRAVFLKAVLVAFEEPPTAVAAESAPTKGRADEKAWREDMSATVAENQN